MLFKELCGQFTMFKPTQVVDKNDIVGERWVYF